MQNPKKQSRSPKSPRLAAFGEALKQARAKARPKLTQQRLATDLSIDTITVSRWELGLSEPNKWLWPQLVERFPSLWRFMPEELRAHVGFGRTGTEG